MDHSESGQASRDAATVNATVDVDQTVRHLHTAVQQVVEQQARVSIELDSVYRNLIAHQSLSTQVLLTIMEELKHLQTNEAGTGSSSKESEWMMHGPMEDAQTKMNESFRKVAITTPDTTAEPISDSTAMMANGKHGHGCGEDTEIVKHETDDERKFYTGDNLNEGTNQSTDSCEELEQLLMNTSKQYEDRTSDDVGEPEQATEAGTGEREVPTEILKCYEPHSREDITLEQRLSSDDSLTEENTVPKTLLSDESMSSKITVCKRQLSSDDLHSGDNTTPKTLATNLSTFDETTVPKTASTVVTPPSPEQKKGKLKRSNVIAPIVPRKPLYRHLKKDRYDRHFLATAIQEHAVQLIDNLDVCDSLLADHLISFECMTEDETSAIRQLPSRKDQVRSVLRLVKGRSYKAIVSFLDHVKLYHPTIVQSIWSCYSEKKNTGLQGSQCTLCIMKGSVDIKMLADFVWSCGQLPDNLYSRISLCTPSESQQDVVWEEFLNCCNASDNNKAVKAVIDALSSKQQYRYLADELSNNLRGTEMQLHCMCRGRGHSLAFGLMLQNLRHLIPSSASGSSSVDPRSSQSSGDPSRVNSTASDMANHQYFKK